MRDAVAHMSTCWRARLGEEKVQQKYVAGKRTPRGIAEEEGQRVDRGLLISKGAD